MKSTQHLVDLVGDYADYRNRTAIRQQIVESDGGSVPKFEAWLAAERKGAGLDGTGAATVKLTVRTK